MNQTSQALEDANESVQLDANYIKAYYRQAMAHIQGNNYAQARDALRSGLALKADDKELLEQLKRVEDRLAGNASAPSSSPAAPPRATNRVTVNHSTKSETVSSSTVPSPSTSSKESSPRPRPTQSPKTEVEVEDDPELKDVRGYKKTSDGRTTTFFNRELDENAKKLIGDIAPKKLDAKGEVITTGTTTGSAWNAAGTYEERILTPWVSSFLTSELSNLSITLPAEQIDSSVRSSSAANPIQSILIQSTGTDGVSGHAQVTMNRGKTKHVCDFTATVKWSVTVIHANGGVTNKVTGQLTVLDLTADKEYEIEDIQVTNFNENTSNFSSLPKDIQSVVNKYIKDSKQGLQKEILVKLERFWAELKSK